MTSNERKEVMKLHDEGWTRAQIAEKFGVNPSSIRDVIKEYEEKKGKREKRENWSRIRTWHAE